MKLGGILIWLVVAPPLAAQSLEVYSEFRRIDPLGSVVTQDRGGRPREILSPAVGRNAFASYHLIVSLPTNTPFVLHVGQNPENSVRVDLYREIYVQNGGQWIPDALEKAPLPVRGVFPEDCQALAFWMDVWTPDRGPSRRIKLEPQLNFSGRWIIYPMEVRIKYARVPPVGHPPGTRAGIADPTDHAARGALQSYLCGGREAPPESPLTIRRMIARNAQQDMALARALERKMGRDTIAGGLLKALGASDLPGWCAAPSFPGDAGPEWYLKLRDFLLRAQVP